MKAEVIKQYVDRDSKSLCEPGKVLDYSDQRAEELISGGYVKAVPSKKQEQTEKNG